MRILIGNLRLGKTGEGEEEVGAVKEHSEQQEQRVSKRNHNPEQQAVQRALELQRDTLKTGKGSWMKLQSLRHLRTALAG